MASRKKKNADGAGEEIVICCHPVGVALAIPGSRRLACAGCGQMVWLSAATERQVAGKNDRVLCDECVARETGDEGIETMPVSEVQTEEMQAAIPGLSRADILKRLRPRNPGRRRAAVNEPLREARRRGRLKN